MASPCLPPLTYDYSSALLEHTGLAEQQLREIELRLEAARREMLDVDLALLAGNSQIPEAKQPLDAGFIRLPERLLSDYERDRSHSELGQILEAAQRLREMVDRVVVLGIGGSYMGARALMQACCHPYHNELSRGQRGGRPRLYFEGNNVDNDAIQGLLDVLRSSQGSQAVEDRWGLIVISKSGGTLETAVAFRLFLDALREACAGDREMVAQRVLPVTGTSGKLYELAQAIGCRKLFRVPDGVGGRFSVFSAVGLLPAAVLGLDVVSLLRGAAAMNDHFHKMPVGQNLVLQYAAVSQLMETFRQTHIRVLSVWSTALESLGLWYDQLFAESLGKRQLGATPLTVVNTRDLHSRAQQHQEGRRDKMITNVIVDRWRRDPLSVSESDLNQDSLNAIAGRTLPEIMQAAIAGTNQAYREDGRPTASLHLPALDEASLGQVMQMLMLATVIEGRLMGINPYGQPGVEAYKRHMKSHLNLA